jgi:formyl-CoA transferase
VPRGRINSYSEILADPQVEHMGWIEDMQLPSGIKSRTFGTPVRISGTDLAKRRDPPALGADTEAIFGALDQRKAAE